MQRWPAAIPAGLAGSRPRLCLVQAILALAGVDVAGAGPPLDAAERASAAAEDEPFEPSAGKAASMLVNVPAAIALGRAALAQLRGDAGGTAAFASQALSKTGEGEWMLDSTARMQLAMAEWLRRSAPTSRRWRSPRRRAGRLCLRLGSPSSAWGRWPTSGMNSRLRRAR